MKDFDSWNEQKKRVDAQEFGRLYRAREVWWCALGINVGYEQDGAGEQRTRPVLVLKAFSAHVCLVVPLTTSSKRNRFYIEAGVVGDKEAAVIISQIRLIDTRRLEKKIEVMRSEIFEKIRKSVKDML